MKAGHKQVAAQCHAGRLSMTAQGTNLAECLGVRLGLYMFYFYIPTTQIHPNTHKIQKGLHSGGSFRSFIGRSWKCTRSTCSLFKSVFH